MNPHLERAQLLYEQSRYELAEKELRQALNIDPQDAWAHALLGLCLAHQENFEAATFEVRQAIHLAPDFPFAHYAHAQVLYDRNHYPEARAAVEEAIRLDSTNAAYFALLAALHFDDKRWANALSAAEQGLQFDPEHIGCTNLRAMTMVKLGRRAEAGATIDVALSKNPGNSTTHANQGWTLLEKGDSKKALEHFREALRLDPTNDWARHGIVEALKARNIIYAMMLKYFLWMSKLSRGAQWGIIIGGYIGNQMLGGLARSNPDLAPWVLPLRAIYIAFVVLTWTAYPVFNLMLRLNRFGRYALTPEQTLASNWVGTTFFLALLALGGCIAFGFDGVWLSALLVFGLLTMPLSAVFNCPLGWPRTTMAAVVGSLALVGLAATALAWQASDGSEQRAKETVAVGLLTIFAFGILGFQFLGNFLVSQRPRR